MNDTDQAFLGREVGGTAFGTDALGYHRARLPYPSALYDELFGRLPAAPSVLEIGAGSGLVTEALLARNPKRLVAVEPDPALVEFTERRLANPKLNMVASSFEKAQLDEQFDLIACAAAFHWMEPRSALSRVKSLLQPQGLWAMWWHSYRNPGRGDALADQITPLLRDIPLPPSDTLLRHYSLDAERQRRILLEAGFQSIEYRLYEQERELTTNEVTALFGSYSYVRVLPHERRTRLLEAIAEIVEKSFGGKAPNLVLTPLYFATPQAS